jgi:hypothetical protein
MQFSPLASETTAQRSCRRWRFSSVVLAALALCQPLSRAQETEPWQPPGVVASFSFKNDDSLITVPVTINGTERTFVLDTGCSLTILDTSIVAGLTQRSDAVRVETLRSTTSMAQYFSPKIRIQDVECGHVTTVLSTDLQPISRALRCKVDGILGMDILKTLIVHIDFDRGVLLFLDRDKLFLKHIKMGVPPGRSMPLTFGSDGIPYISAQPPGIPYAVFRIDTGMTATGALRSDDYSSLQSAGQVRSFAATANFMNADGTTTNKEYGRCQEFSVAEFSYQGLIFTSGTTNSLGLNFLRRHRVTLDFVRTRAYFEPSRGFAFRDRGDNCGLILDEYLVIQHVDPHSLGAKAGFEQSDELLTMDGADAREIDRYQVNEILRTPRDSDLIFTVQRGENTVGMVIEGG